MNKWYNDSGRPLSSLHWLEAHHHAKLPERTKFAKKILELNPKRIVDLGCGPGIWLELLNEYAGRDCEFIGLDTDDESVFNARTRASAWNRQVSFKCIDIENDINLIPDSDIYLAFNIFPYIKDASRLLDHLKKKLNEGGMAVIRQYDGGLLRIGPMNHGDRQLIDNSLFSAVAGSKQFKHYDADRIFEIISGSSFSKKSLEFETFSRFSPYPNEFLGYFNNSIEWTIAYLSDDAAEKLKAWHENKFKTNQMPSYWCEVDLIAWLS